MCAFLQVVQYSGTQLPKSNKINIFAISTIYFVTLYSW